MEDDIIYQQAYLLELIEKRMLKTLTKPVEKFLFIYIYQQGHKGIEAADVLDINTTNVSRHLKKMRRKLRPYLDGYEDTVGSKIKGM